MSILSYFRHWGGVSLSVSFYEWLSSLDSSCPVWESNLNFCSSTSSSYFIFSSTMFSIKINAQTGAFANWTSALLFIYWDIFNSRIWVVAPACVILLKASSTGILEKSKSKSILQIITPSSWFDSWFVRADRPENFYNTDMGIDLKRGSKRQTFKRWVDIS